MIARLFKSRRVEPEPPSLPAGERVYAVGDIHGRADLLDDLLAQIDRDDAARGGAHTTLIFLGDLVDRGPDSAGVVTRLAKLADERADVRFLLGNHEEVFLLALNGDEKALRMFCRIGGRETIQSYGVSDAEYDAMDFAELGERLRALVPASHDAFLSGFEDLIRIGDYVFVHAGVRPGVPFAEQRASDLRWIRDTFLDHGQPHEGFIVHGHTITEAPDERSNRVGIDTGAYYSGRLTALGIEGTDRWLLQTEPREGDGIVNEA